jgi:alkanesulfonate monooxygenase SsuD/methylene tetrahydromethanopterin reductase-like flavin-dependent oxidoreductase (luciferase family)
MKYGFVFPGGEARTAAEFAREAETAGWDGFFVWEPVWGVDAWVTLAAAAMVTERIRLGTMITPVSRMRPWKLASETATLDNLSDGRVILSVGLGAIESGFEAFGEVTERKTRAGLLDEGLEILTGLWQGQPFNYNGKFYQVRQTDFMPPPPPRQQPRIPIWVVGAWPSARSMGRAIQYDGILPNILGEDGHVRMTPTLPEEIRQIKEYIIEKRGSIEGFDIVVEGETPNDEGANAAGIVQPYIEAGATWWIEAMWQKNDLEAVLNRLRQGPPLAG